jgi:hypothetical protein
VLRELLALGQPRAFGASGITYFWGHIKAFIKFRSLLFFNNYRFFQSVKDDELFNFLRSESRFYSQKNMGFKFTLPPLLNKVRHGNDCTPVVMDHLRSHSVGFAVHRFRGVEEARRS